MINLICGDSKEKKEETLKYIKNKSYADFREWAIRNDFID